VDNSEAARIEIGRISLQKELKVRMLHDELGKDVTNLEKIVTDITTQILVYNGEAPRICFTETNDKVLGLQ